MITSLQFSELPAYLRDAIQAHADTSFDCGDWRDGFDDPFGDVYEASEQAQRQLIAAIIRYRKEG